MTIRCEVLLCFLLILVGCQAEPEPEVFRVEFEDADGTWSCRVVVPAGLSEKAPLMIAYHGIGDTPESMARYSQLDELAATHGFLLVYPDAKGKLWKVPVDDAATSDLSWDLNRFDLILEEMEQQYSIDTGQVFVVGMSQGATFVQCLVHERGNQIAAAVAHSGMPSKEYASPRAQTPLLLIAGQDDLVHDAMKNLGQEYHAADPSNDFISVPELGHSWSTANNDTIWEFLSRTRS